MSEIFAQTVQDLLGPVVREEVLQILENSGAPRLDIALHFDEVVQILNRLFGNSARVLVFKTLKSLYEEYSVATGFGFHDSLKDQIALLNENVLANLLKPRHYPGIDDSIYIAKRDRKMN